MFGCSSAFSFGCWLMAEKSTTGWSSAISSGWWLMADAVLREKYYWLVAGGWFVLREKYCWLVADKPNKHVAYR
jgi:hypothetical protein